ncbi:hypothetical protein D9619_012473 [Psilocybe cf. subviscida]|uniref:Uncharacterized protein n=1 Tax=Psilocybe cf. subviscida TaxID=2480587 RepID=A0A8H5AR81_9AGAR|nr:hypothetical protein D9619_012473 [Psilocybe cf. subviscida]
MSPIVPARHAKSAEDHHFPYPATVQQAPKRETRHANASEVAFFRWNKGYADLSSSWPGVHATRFGHAHMEEWLREGRDSAGILFIGLGHGLLPYTYTYTFVLIIPVAALATSITAASHSSIASTCTRGVSSTSGDSALCTASFPSATGFALYSGSSPEDRDDILMKWRERGEKGSGRGYTATSRSSETSDEFISSGLRGVHSANKS